MKRGGKYVRLVADLTSCAYEEGAEATCKEVFAFGEVPTYLFHGWADEFDGKLFERRGDLRIDGEHGLHVA